MSLALSARTLSLLDIDPSDAWGPDVGQISCWIDATGIDLPCRVLDRLAGVSSHALEDLAITVYSIEFRTWARGRDAVYTTGTTAETARTKFKHSRWRAELEIRVNALTPGGEENFSFICSAERLGQNGQIRNSESALGYRTGSDLEHFVECALSPCRRSASIYRILGAHDQADEIEREIEARANGTD